MKKKKHIFVETIDPYQTEILVIVGTHDKRDVYKYLKKLRADAGFKKWVLTNFDEWKEDIKNKNKGQFCWNDSVNKNGNFGMTLVLRDFEDCWQYWEVLIHELNHVVQKLASLKHFLEEAEAMAYLQEHLFRSIRRKLQGTDPLE